MVSNIKISWLLAVLMLLVASSYSRAPQSDIQTICSRALNHGYCRAFFKSKPEAAKADLHGLAKLTVDSAQQIILQIQKQIHTLAKKASDNNSKAGYTSCSHAYNEVVTDIDQALSALAAGNNFGLNIAISATTAAADVCKEDLVGVSPDPSSALKQIGNHVNVSDIALVISNMLP